MVDASITCEHLGKKFTTTLKRSMLHGFTDVGRNLLGRSSRPQVLRKQEFWALQDVTCSVEPGQCVGFIGPNGSGKSTILKVLNGIIMPDVGRVRVRGRVAALIELGAGFHPLLTGRENIFVNGAILGMSRREVRERFDDIVEFADIASFIDAPVRHYSSGMFARLGFAVAAHVDPDVLLVDEVLAVGDADFRSKSYERMIAFKSEGRAVCIVSHDMMSIQAVCDSVVWLEQGRVMGIGRPEDIIPRYYESQDLRGVDRPARRSAGGTATEEFRVTHVDVMDSAAAVVKELSYADAMTIRIHFETDGKVHEPYVIVAVKSPGGGNLFGLNMATDGGYPATVTGRGHLDITYDHLPLYPGLYSIVVQVRKNAGLNYFDPRVMAHFVVESPSEAYGHTGRYRETYIHGGGVAPVVVPYEAVWHLDEGIAGHPAELEASPSKHGEPSGDSDQLG